MNYEQQWVSTAQAALILGLSTQEVRRLCTTGKLDCMRVAKGLTDRWVINPKSISLYQQRSTYYPGRA